LSSIGKDISLDRSTFLRLIHELFAETFVIEVTLQCEGPHLPHKFVTQIYIVNEKVSKKMDDECVVVAFTIEKTMKYLDEIWCDIVISNNSFD
jgi:hypothetical protein